MAYQTGTVTGHIALIDAIRSFVKGQGTYATPIYTGTGNGTLTAIDTFVASVTETWTITCTAVAANGGTFSVVGSISGAAASATVGTPYANTKIAFTINDGTADFILGDHWTIAVTQGAMTTDGHAWIEKEAIITGSTFRQLWWQAPGMSGTEQIFMGMRSYDSVASDYYNLAVFGATGFVTGNTYITQPGYSGEKGVPLWNQPITYWMICNGQRLCVVAKIQNVYESFYIGKFLPYATPSQYPYPLAIGGMLTTAAATRYSDINHVSWFKGNVTNFVKRFVDGSWTTTELIGNNYNQITLRNTVNSSGTAIGDYGIYPLVLTTTTNMYGELDGIFFISGFNNAVENILTIAGVDYLVVRDVWRTDIKDYIAMRLN